MMLAVGLLHMAFVEVSSLYPHLLLVFIKNEYWISSNAFSAFIDKIMWFLSFTLFKWYIRFIDLQIMTTNINK